MPVTVVVGGEWGDEGKGTIVDLLAQESDIIIRNTGGGNTGRTVVNEQGEIRLHLVPAGIFNSNAICVIGNGVVVDLFSDRFFKGKGSLFTEIQELADLGVEVTPERLKISHRAHLVMPWHIWIDEAQEERRGKGLIGTTKRGIGPCFADRAMRVGIRMEDLFDSDYFEEKVRGLYRDKLQELKWVYKVWNENDLPAGIDEAQKEELKERLRREYEILSFRDFPSEEEVLIGCLERQEVILRYIAETHNIIREAMSENKRILLEGSQGVLLDLDLGIEYKYVTSTDVTPTGLAHCGIGVKEIDKVIGVFKAFYTRVAPGPLPTELTEEEVDILREAGNEYGATTGRPRRCGWFDAVLARYAVNVAGITHIALTKMDTFSCFDTVKICIGYEGMAAHPLTYFDLIPLRLLNCAKPIYIEMPSWGDIRGCRNYEELPKEARDFVEAVEMITEKPVEFISVGPARDEIVRRNPKSVERSLRRKLAKAPVLAAL